MPAQGASDYVLIQPPLLRTMTPGPQKGWPGNEELWPRGPGAPVCRNPRARARGDPASACRLIALRRARLRARRLRREPDLENLSSRPYGHTADDGWLYWRRCPVLLRRSRSPPPGCAMPRSNRFENAAAGPRWFGDVTPPADNTLTYNNGAEPKASTRGHLRPARRPGCAGDLRGADHTQPSHPRASSPARPTAGRPARTA